MKTPLSLLISHLKHIIFSEVMTLDNGGIVCSLHFISSSSHFFSKDGNEGTRVSDTQ